MGYRSEMGLKICPGFFDQDQSSTHLKKDPKEMKNLADPMYPYMPVSRNGNKDPQPTCKKI